MLRCRFPGVGVCCLAGCRIPPVIGFFFLSKGLKEFHEECLSAHNEYRIRHGAPPLHWSAELAWEAQQWAENLARIGELRHNDDDTLGENLAGMTGGELSGREAVDMWYEEIENYNFDCHGYGEDTSNFTQVWLIWNFCNFAFLQSFLDSSESFFWQNAYQLSWNYIGMSGLENIKKKLSKI